MHTHKKANPNASRMLLDLRVLTLLPPTNIKSLLFNLYDAQAIGAISSLFICGFWMQKH